MKFSKWLESKDYFDFRRKRGLPLPVGHMSKTREILPSYSKSDVPSDITGIEDMMMHHDRILDSEDISDIDIDEFASKLRKYLISIAPKVDWRDNSPSIEVMGKVVSDLGSITERDIMELEKDSDYEEVARFLTKALEMLRSLKKNKTHS